MKRPKNPVIIIMLCVLIVFVAARLFADPSPQPTQPPIPTPLPVTPIEPPEGIRSSITNDPRDVYPLAQTEPTALTVTRSKLDRCLVDDGAEKEAGAIAIDQFVADVYLLVCGYSNEDMTVIARIEAPDGTIVEKQIVTAENDFHRDNRNAAIVNQDMPVSEPRTTFSIELSSLDGEFSAEQTFHLPKQPRGYLFESGDIWLYGFVPNENVQLLRYDVSERYWEDWETGGGIIETYSLVHYETIAVDDDGAFSVRQYLSGVAGSSVGQGPYGLDSIVIAVGEQSGEIRTRGFPPYAVGAVIED